MGRRSSAVPPILLFETTSLNAWQSVTLTHREELGKRKPFALLTDLHQPSALCRGGQNFSFFNVRL